MRLTFNARGFLGGEDGVRLRAQLELDTLDMSLVPIDIVIPDAVTAVDQEFAEAFLLPTARKSDAGLTPLSLSLYGPYSLVPETPTLDIHGSFSRVSHRICRVIEAHIFTPENMARHLAGQKARCLPQ